MVVSETDDGTFLPLPGDLLVNLSEKQDLLAGLFEKLPAMFASSQARSHARRCVAATVETLWICNMWCGARGKEGEVSGAGLGRAAPHPTHQPPHRANLRTRLPPPPVAQQRPEPEPEPEP